MKILNLIRRCLWNTCFPSAKRQGCYFKYCVISPIWWLRSIKINQNHDAILSTLLPFVIGLTVFFHCLVFIVRISYWMMYFTYHFYVIFLSWGNLNIYDIKKRWALLLEHEVETAKRANQGSNSKKRSPLQIDSLHAKLFVLKHITLD